MKLSSGDVFKTDKIWLRWNKWNFILHLFYFVVFPQQEL